MLRATGIGEDVAPPREGKDNRRSLTAIFIFLNIGDLILTMIGIVQGKQEMNPVANLLMEQVGILPALVALKLISVAIVLAVAKRVPLFLPFGCIAVAFAVLWNLSELAS